MEKTSEIVLVPVPVHLLPSIYAVLAEGTRQQNPDPNPSAPFEPFGGVVQTRKFDADELAQLKRSLKPDGGARAMLDLCASKPDQWVGYDQVVSASGIAARQLRGQLGAFTKMVKKLFNGRAEWPVQFQWAIGGSQQAYYVMTPTIAAIWNDL
jgi:hypothetical protein